MEMFLKAVLTTHFLLCRRFLILAQRHSPSENMRKVKPEILDFIINLCRSLSKRLENTNPCGMFACSDSSFVLSPSPSNICCSVSDKTCCQEDEKIRLFWSQQLSHLLAVRIVTWVWLDMLSISLSTLHHALIWDQLSRPDLDCCVKETSKHISYQQWNVSPAHHFSLHLQSWRYLTATKINIPLAD